MLCIDNVSEFIVLYRVFYGFKYGIDSDQMEKLLRSPYFSKIFNESLKEMLEKLSEVEGIDKSNMNINDYHIDKKPEEREIIKKHLLEIENWCELDVSIKKEIVEMSFSPFLYDDTASKLLIQEIDGSC